MKSVHIRRYSGLHFPAFGLNTERYGVSFRIQSECGKMRTRLTLNRDTFYAVHPAALIIKISKLNVKKSSYFKNIFQKYFTLK